MRVDKLTLERIFERTERLEAPLFQRPYVWKQERNWLPLWEAIRKVADARVAGKEPRPCFLGAIVLDQLKTSTGKLHARQIIDGQQRLTTLQLAIAAARDLCVQKARPEYADAFKTLAANHVPLSKSADDRFKVWPTNADRADFRSTMTAGSIEAVREHFHADDDEDDGGLIPNAYLFFAATLLDWLGNSDGDQLAGRLEAMYFAIKGDLHLVVIDLEEQDDAQVIFETLNALGTPLLPTDLVKNFLFHLAEHQKLDTEQLYQKYWATFDMDKDFWREEIRQGRLKRSRLDLFMNDYLTLRLSDEVSAAVLFSSFREYVRDRPDESAAVQMQQFRAYADVYRSFGNFAAESREGQFFYRLEQLDTTTVNPLLLEVLKRHNNAKGRAELIQILTDLESFLVRRAICELTTKNYNRFFVDMIKALVGGPGLTAGSIRAYLLAQTQDTNRWPNDDDFRTCWMEVNFYKRLKKSKARMILEAIDQLLFDSNSETVILVQKNLTIEHLLPQEWGTHWPLPSKGLSPDGLELATKTRDDMLNRVGNLTLLTGKLNTRISNGPWEKKREQIIKHTVLNMNRAFQDAPVWDEALIAERSSSLFALALKLWPRPIA